MPLYNLIKQDIHTLNETSIPRLQRRLQKLASAGQRSIAYCALLDEKNQSLTKMNNEAKVRRSTKSVVLGKTKVMSFEDIEVARAAHAAKGGAKGKRKRGRKRKSAALDEGEPELEPEPKVARATKEAIKSTRKRARKRKNIAPEADQPEPEPEQMPVPESARRIIPPKTWSAPVARMY
ncbi:hypothetical protein B0O99DRAFT_594547 [Bisporella sp. PMI_857]|nr:hypothetical protein B0O99DRAFT_594547 [Bisporella sp. PMI_857]